MTRTEPCSRRIRGVLGGRTVLDTLAARPLTTGGVEDLVTFPCSAPDAWYDEFPTAPPLPVAGLVAFDDEKVEVTVT